MVEELRDCESCKFFEQAADYNDTSTRCGNCLYVTRREREYFPSWEPREEDEDYDGPPIINYIRSGD